MRARYFAPFRFLLAYRHLFGGYAQLAESDEDERAFTITLIEHCIQLALRHLTLSVQELEILQHMARTAAQNQHAATAKGGAPPSALSAAGSGSGSAAAAVLSSAPID
jgi:hypothetical protein